MADLHIGPYRLLRLLHEGGQGQVFLGQDDRLQRRVAIKIYTLPEVPAARRQVLSEARMLARLQHPGVVQVYDVIAGDEHLAMVMEYVSGCDLDELLAHVNPGLAETLDIVEGIAGALGAAASRQIIHGDLKAANILVNREGRIKLVDFGIAGVVGEAQGGRGSLSCLSPEQVQGAPLDTRTDLFALGCLLYRLLSGEYPFYRQRSLDRAALLTGDYPALPALAPCGEQIPDDLALLLSELLALDPAERPSSLAGLRLRLHQMHLALPRRVSRGLLRLATPVFREESVAELPLPLPTDLLQQDDRHWYRWMRMAAWPPATRRVALALAGLILLPLVIWGAWQWGHIRPLTVQLMPLELRLVPGVAIPGHEGPDWIADQVRDSLEREGLHPLSVAEIMPSIDESLYLRLQCREDLCLLGLTRATAAGQASGYRQALLPPAAGPVAWRGLIGDAVAALYRKD